MGGIEGDWRMVGLGKWNWRDLVGKKEVDGSCGAREISSKLSINDKSSIIINVSI